MEILEKIIEWTKLKCRIQASAEKEVYFREREVWWASIGANIGSEQDGKYERFERPVLIFKKFSENLAWVIPATSKAHAGTHYFRSPSAERPQTFMLMQLRAMSPKRLLRKQRSLPMDEFDDLRNRLKTLI
jgi:mRNA-degrading endonuclease toxin of MazEF toxin-antitoxin module